MYLQFQLKGLEALRIRDNFLNPFDRDVEIFQTWQIHETQNLVPDENEAKFWTKTGFSTTGANEDGVRFRKGESRLNLFDPTISFSLPKLEENAPPKQFQIDYHFWEADSRKSTAKIRALYSNDILKFLSKAYEDAHKDEEEAKKALFEYLNENEENVVKILSNAAYALAPAAPWIPIAQALYPIIIHVGKLIAANSTDYIGMQSFWLEIKNVAGTYQWRFFSNNLDTVTFDWREANGKLVLPSEVLTDASGGISLRTTFQGVMRD